MTREERAATQKRKGPSKKMESLWNSDKKEELEIKQVIRSNITLLLTHVRTCNSLKLTKKMIQ